jgi:hypothetical protein
MRWPWSRRPAPEAAPGSSGSVSFEPVRPRRNLEAPRARAETRLPVYPEPPSPAQLGVDLRVGWLRADPAIEADVKQFWARWGLLPQGVDPEQRVKEVVLAAYAGGRLVAVSTAVVELVPFLRSKMAVYRCAMDPEHRRQFMSVLITAHSVRLLEQWSLATPAEEVMGVLAVLEAATYKTRSHPHRAPETRLSLVGFTPAGEKIVAAWFDHALV